MKLCFLEVCEDEDGWASAALLVTDAGLMESGLVEQVQKIMGQKLAGVYADVPQDSGMEVVDRIQRGDRFRAEVTRSAE